MKQFYNSFIICPEPTTIEPTTIAPRVIKIIKEEPEQSNLYFYISIIIVIVLLIIGGYFLFINTSTDTDNIETASETLPENVTE